MNTQNEFMGRLNYACMLALMATAISLFGSDAFAAVSGQKVVDMISGVCYSATLIVSSLGTIAIIVIGITAMFGRITWTQALVVAIGIALASGAAGIYTDLTSKSVLCAA